MAKQRKVRESKSVGNDLNTGDLAGLLFDVVPELREAYTRADIELALDDRGWLTSKATAHQELDPQTRISLVTKARLYWLRDPLAKQAIRLWTDYSLGTGITYTATDKAVQASLDGFVKDRRNKRIMNSEGQRKSSKKLLIDGEVFFAIFQAGTGKSKNSKVVRLLDPLQITDIITDPEDSERILGYRRQLPHIHGKQPKAVFYADWAADADDRALAETQTTSQQEKVSFESDVVVYHLPFDAIFQRGNGLLSSVVDWTREHRRFMEARVAITQSLSKYAQKLTVKGGQKAVDAVKAKLQSTYATTNAATVEKNPQTAPGGSWVQNDAIDLTPIPRATGAGDSEKDGNQLKLMVSAGVGIMLHYFGDPSTGNLATATAMELPMLKMFESYQELWKDAYKVLFTIVMDDDENDGSADVDEVDVIIDLPPILADDLQALGTAFTAFAQMWPELADDDEILTMVLTAMRVNDIDAVLKNLRVKRDERKKQADQDQIKMAKLMGGGATGASALTAKETAAITAALVRVAESLEK